MCVDFVDQVYLHIKHFWNICFATLKCPQRECFEGQHSYTISFSLNNYKCCYCYMLLSLEQLNNNNIKGIVYLEVLLEDDCDLTMTLALK